VADQRVDNEEVRGRRRTLRERVFNLLCGIGNL